MDKYFIKSAAGFLSVYIVFLSLLTTYVLITGIVGFSAIIMLAAMLVCYFYKSMQFIIKSVSRSRIR